MTHYVHSIPGRLRVRAPFLKRTHGIDRDVVELLSPLGGIDAVSSNPLTGSLVIIYDAEALRAAQILDVLRLAGYFDPGKAVTNDQYIHKVVSRTGGFLWKSISGAFVETAVSHPAVSLLMVFI
jgi:hypothetical protein